MTLSNGQPGRIRYSFTYRFSAEMRLMEVRASTETERIYVMMRKAGRVSGNLDQEYVRRLRDRLRYWNGETWQNAAAPVAWDRTIVHAP